MFLVQLLLPVYEGPGRRVPRERFTEVRDELTHKYGGVTAFLRSPAQGTWKEQSGTVDHDDVVMCEVMVDSLDRSWWTEYRSTLERRFGQRELVMRAVQIERL